MSHRGNAAVVFLFNVPELNEAGNPDDAIVKPEATNYIVLLCSDIPFVSILDRSLGASLSLSTLIYSPE
jgi:hypothetical protein